MASDVNGCSGNMEGPPTISLEPEARFVVLMARNNCTFYEKVVNAEKAGFDAAIVYNIDSDDLVEMSGDSGSTEDVRIPAMFIGYYSAMEIMKIYAYEPVMSNYSLVLNRNLPFNINTHLLWPFVALVVIVFLTMIVMTIVRWVRHRNRVARERLPHRELHNLPIVKYDPDTCRYETCSICLEDYELGERLRVLPCMHMYHTKCIDPWLTRGKRNCPLCKRKIRTRRVTRRTSTDSDTSSGSSAVDTTPLLNNGGGGGGGGAIASNASAGNNNNVVLPEESLSSGRRVQK